MSCGCIVFVKLLQQQVRFEQFHPSSSLNLFWLVCLIESLPLFSSIFFFFFCPFLLFSDKLVHVEFQNIKALKIVLKKYSLSGGGLSAEVDVASVALLAPSLFVPEWTPFN